MTPELSVRRVSLPPQRCSRWPWRTSRVGAADAGGLRPPLGAVNRPGSRSSSYVRKEMNSVNSRREPGRGHALAESPGEETAMGHPDFSLASRGAEGRATVGGSRHRGGWEVTAGVGVGRPPGLFVTRRQEADTSRRPQMRKRLLRGSVLCLMLRTEAHQYRNPTCFPCVP